MDALKVILIPLLPFVSFVCIALFGRRYFKNACAPLGTLALFASFILSAWVAYEYFFVIGKSEGVYQKFELLNTVWLQFSSSLHIDLGLMIDPLSVMMLIVVTFISFLVHLYSLGYMHDDERIATFYAYLSLFTFSMLGLVLSTNIFQIYIFWELVGLSSFLLIGFYYQKPSAVAAAKKAFIVTRFADFGFLIGILILSYYSDTLNFGEIITRLTTEGTHLGSAVSASFLGLSSLTWALLLIFMGGAGKSAMFPLHIWLPDAMEGPTPVSALIHAATMVVAGVYLVARLFPIYAISCPAALDVVATVGIFSSFFAAIIACTQTDIKRVLAYSTMSQIGFMMFSLGVSGYAENGLGYTASLFHLFTHAMFKALLFLGAGAVIHFVHSNEMNDMGGLRKSMPVTHLSFLIACLAISGVPPLAGFFSKEEILLATYQSNKLFFGIALLTSGITAFYMFRLYYSIFWNKPSAHHGDSHHSEAPMTMKMPLLILMIITVMAGFVPFGNFVSSDGLPLHGELHLQFSIAPVLLGLCGIGLAAWLYRKPSETPQRISESIKFIYQSAYRKFYIDEIYLFITKTIVFKGFGSSVNWIEKNAVNEALNTSAMVTGEISESVKDLQSGKIQDYLLYFLIGFLGIALLLVYLLV